MSRLIWGRQPAAVVAEPDLPPLEPAHVPEEMRYEAATAYRPPELRPHAEPNGNGANGHAAHDDPDLADDEPAQHR